MFKKIIVFLFIVFMYSEIYAWSYPLREVSKPIAKCKFSYWKTLGSSCKITLPKLTPNLYTKYKNDINFYRRIYTVLWASSYKYCWDQGNGTHLGTDFATSLGTPVYSIGPGRVVFAGKKGARGKVVIIQHKVNGKYIYSNYAHLNKIYVTFNQRVTENTKIGEVGHSGNSYGNHLHLQIDTNQSIGSHPFWFRYCKGKSISAIVNSTSCLPEMERATIDPLAFLASNGAIIKKVEQQKVYKPKTKISRKNLVSYEDIQRRIVDEFLRTHKFSFNFYNAGVYKLGKYGIFTISLKDYRGRIYKDLLPEDITIVYDKNYFSSFSPRGLKIIDGTRKISFLPKKTGTTYIQIKMGKKTIYQKAIRIIKPGQYVEPKQSKLITLHKYPYVGTPNWGINIFRDKNYVNIVKVPFAGTYYLSSITNDITFCKAGTNLKYLNYFHCNAYNMSKIIKFSYKDTIFGLFIFKYFSNTGKKTKIIVKDLKGNIIGQSKYLLFKQIKLTNNKTLYKNDILSACKKGLCLNVIDRGYIWVDKKLSLYTAKYLLENISTYLGKKYVLTPKKIDKTKYITRLKFIKFVLASLNVKVKDYKSYKLKYMDIKNLSQQDKNYIVYLTKLGFTWKDSFAKYHFQPNKVITISEALYVINFLIKKYR